MQIRPYRDADLDVLKQLTIDAFQGVSIDENISRVCGSVGGHDWRWFKARAIDEDVQSAGACIWVAEDEAGHVAGYITTRIDREASVGLIPNLAVRRETRGQGVGRMLIEHALAEFRAAGLQLARIETLDQNPIGQHLYPDCGFVEVARQIHFAMRLDSRP